MTEYEPDTGLNAAITTVLSERKFAEFKPLNDQNIKVLAFLKVTTNSEGDHAPCKGCPVKVQKVSDLNRAAGIDADYIILVDYYAWNHPKGVNPVDTQEAMLHHALKMIKVEVKDGKVKKGKNEPEIVEFADTAIRYPSVMADYRKILAPAMGFSAQLAATAAEEPARVEMAVPQHLLEAAEPEAEPETEPETEPEEDQPRVRRGGRK